jgi:hypothetical protein
LNGQLEDEFLRLGDILTAILISFALVGVGLFVFNQMNQAQMSYQSHLDYSVSKAILSYDYSCDQQVYSLNFLLSNNGSKLVNNLAISVTNPLCVGAVPPLPPALAPHQQLMLDLYTTSQNGTITVMGNDTVLLVRF